MVRDIAIDVKDVHKTFRIPHEASNSLKSAALNLFKKKTFTDLKTADGISFKIKKGEFFGIIGRNGCGKSTMLKMLAGIYLPNKGKITINGRISPFLELGVGFNPELSARDNIYLNGAILGLTRKEINEKFEEIVEFSELREFLDQKLKNFSSGMQVRLAFAVAIHAHADILLIDEVLAVGDVNFQKKCLEKFRDFKNQNKTVVFVSHSMGYVKDFCDRVAVFEKGELKFIGETTRGVDVYNKLNVAVDEKEAEEYNEGKVGTSHLGTGGALISGFKIYNGKGKESLSLKTGESFKVALEVKYNKDVKVPAVGVMFRRNPLENLYGINNYFEKMDFGAKQAGTTDRITFEDTMPLNPGDYYLSFSISDARSSTEYEELDMLENVMKVAVSSEKEEWGIVRNTAKISESK